MSFNSKNFSVLAYANGFTLWSYSTEDTLPNINSDGYFNEITPFARQGDMILVTANNTAEPESAILSVTSVASSAVVKEVASTMVAAA